MKKIDHLIKNYNEGSERKNEIANLLSVLEKYIEEKVEDMSSELLCVMLKM